MITCVLSKWSRNTFHCFSNVVDFYVMWNSEYFVVVIMHSNECIIFLENEVFRIFF
jgi:hypothetical protein